MRNWVHEIWVGLSLLLSFENGHELISANSRTSADKEALFSAGLAKLIR